jgi:hypothetical protein
MPDSLEYVVRPWQTPNAHGSIIIPSTPRGSRERATLSWGHDASITMPTPVEVNEGVNFETVCCTENLNETHRETEDIQIYDSSGGTTYITVERPKSLRLKKKDKNNCFGPGLSETSDVAQGINASNAMWEAALNSGTTKTHTTCSVGWNFTN